MRKCSLMLVLVPIAALSVAWLPHSVAKPAPLAKKEGPALPKPTENWKDDPVCRMVFFAVLEGLYEDGVSSEAVDRVVGRKAKGGPADLKVTFVIQCPLCHPVYEAFCLYQQRPTFSGDKARRDTFGKGLSPDVERNLQSKNLGTRQGALRMVVQQWVGRRLTMMRLSAAEKTEWSRRLGERSQQGKQRLGELISKDPYYKGWSTYTGCPACDGTTRACSALKTPQKKE